MATNCMPFSFQNLSTGKTRFKAQGASAWMVGISIMRGQLR